MDSASLQKVKARRLGAGVLGEVGMFYRQVTSAQILVFVIWSAAGVLTGEGFGAFAIRLLAICYLIVFNFCVVHAARAFTVRTLAFHLSGLVSLLSVASLLARQNMLISVFYPSALIFLCLALVRAAWREMLYICGPALGFLALYWLIFACDDPSWAAKHAVGLLCAAGGFLLALLHAAVRGGENKPVKQAEAQIPLGSGMRVTARLPFVHETESEVRYRKKLMQRTEDNLSAELLTALTWQFVGGVLVLSTTIISAAAALGMRDRRFVSGWIIMVLLQALLISLLQQQRRPRLIYLNALAVSAGGFGWWWLACALPAGSLPFPAAVLSLVILIFGVAPWPRQWNHVFTCLTIGLLACSLLLGEVNLLMSGVVLLLLFFTARTSALYHLAMTSRALTLAYGDMRQLEVSAMACLRGLGWQATLLTGARRVLVTAGAQRCEVVTGKKLESSAVDPVYVRGLMQKIADTEDDLGLLRYDQLGEQFKAPLDDWFGGRPTALVFLSLSAVIDDKEEKVSIFVPVSAGMRFVGMRNVCRSLAALVDTQRISLETARLRFLSSGALLNTQRSISEGEQELNQVVHYVNNLAQDIAIQCENLRGVLTAAAPSGAAPQSVEALAPVVEQIDLYAHMLSARVTDVKLVKELLRLKDVTRLEIVELGPVLAELELYGRDRALRKGEESSLLHEMPEEVGVKAASREFLETSLRAMVQAAGVGLGKHGRIVLRVRREADQVSFAVCDSGAALDAEIQQRILSGEPVSGSVHRKVDGLRAVLNLARVGGGEFKFMAPPEGLVNCMALHLPACVITEDLPAAANHWALLVDDNAEVTTFYARVAQALNLKYCTASSLAEAEALIASQGKPRIVITDVQLQDGNGIDLVKSVRAKFGGAVPVMVVSGDADEAVAAEARAAGGTKFLTKPVNRRRLFAEIKESLLGEV